MFSPAVISHRPAILPQSIALTAVLGNRAFRSACTWLSALPTSAASAMPATLRAAPVATRRRDRRVSERTRSIADIDTLQENNFDIDPGRHFDHRLILPGALDQQFRHHVRSEEHT